MREFNKIMRTNFNKNDILTKMDKALNALKKDLSTIRTGRANISMLDLVSIEAYGKKMPVNQLATVTTPEARTISIQVWDKSNVVLIDSAIKKSNLGVNPQVNGQTIRINIPQLTEERRVELVKNLKGLGEKGKVSIRNIRRDSNDHIKKQLKEKTISEDESKNFEKEIQKITDDNIKKIDKILSEKEKEILSL